MSTVLAVELLCAAQAIDLRAGTAVPGPAAAAVHALIRAHVPAMDVDREVTPQIEAVRDAAAGAGRRGRGGRRTVGLTPRPAGVSASA